MTRTTQAGAGKRLPVENVWCFSAGYKTPDGSIVIPGDEIMVAGKKDRVTAVDRETSSLVLAEDISWNKDDPVSYAYIGTGPDIGAVESR